MAFQTAPPDAPVRLDFPEEVELKVVVDTVAATLGLNIAYDIETLTNKKVALRATAPVPRAQLLDLLRTLLRTKGLLLLRTEPAGWWKIVPLDKLAAEAGPPRQELPLGGDESDVIAYLLPLQHADAARLQTALTPYLTKPGGTLLALPDSRALVVTDTLRSVRQIAALATLLDTAAPPARVVPLPVRFQDPAELAALVTRLLTEQARQEGGPALVPLAAPLTLLPDPQGKGLLAIGLPERIEQARQLIERFDVAVLRRTELYQPHYVSASRLKTLIEQLVGTIGLKLAADDAANTLLVIAADAEHKQIRKLLEQFDAAPLSAATPLRFYKLLHRRADDVFATLGAVLGGRLEQSAGMGPASRPANGSERPVGGPAYQFTDQETVSTASGPQPREKSGNPGLSVRGANFSLSLDEHTNSILVSAPPELHQQIEQLLQQLDKRRPQVLVEVTLVSISIDDSVNLGVELQTQDLGQPWDYELFTSFGLSTINPTTGERRMIPATGGSGALIAPDEVPIILQALASRGDTKVYSAPRILVDDNAVGRIESVAESPFTSVNASNTVATTSFAGFAKAGTQLSIEPHIAQGDHLELDYTLTVSSFTGSGTAAAPPPRSSDTLSSTIRVPDGHTVVVGGLRTETVGDTASQVPLLGDVPALGWLFGSRSHSKSKVRLYAFIRPTVLRDTGFEDLKYVSLQDLKAAGVPDGWPPTRLQYVTPNGPWRPVETKNEDAPWQPGWTPASKP